MCESADDFYEARYLFTQHSLDHGALPCWVTINKNRRGSINFYTTRYLYIKEKNMYKCEYCRKEFETYQGLAGHKSHCPLNPNKKRTHESTSEANKKARLTYIAKHPEKYVKKVFKFICPKCGNEYEVLKTECEIKKGDYKKYCSLTCANSHTISQETRNKISQSLKTSDKAKEAALNSYTTYYCKNCGKPFTLKDERDTTGRKYCSLQCKEEWLKTNLYSKCGGYRKGSGVGKKGWYKGIYCDSSWELAFVIYHIDNNLPIKRCTQKRVYFYKGIKHYYYPDFETKEGVIEIKGYISEQWKAKEEQNPDVIVLYKKDIKKYLDYVTLKYGNDFIALYDNSNPKHLIDNKKYIWLHNEHENVFVKPEQYEEYISKGYIRGRINKFRKKEWHNYKIGTKVRDENGRTEAQKQAHIKTRKVKRPSLDILQNLSKTLSNIQIGKMYGVTESSIRRWKKYYNII